MTVNTTFAIIVSTIGAFCATLVFTPIARAVALRLGVVDRPDGRRKMHGREVARVGGLPLILSYCAAVILAAREFDADLLLKSGAVAPVLPPMLLVLLLGFTDDVWGLSAFQKLIGQFAGAVMAIACGVQITTFGGVHVPPFLGAVFTIVWLIGCANALNLIDGLDGLASGVAFLAAAAIMLSSFLHGHNALAFAMMPLIAAIAAFTPYNVAPATVFLGDSGSLTLGFLLGCFALIGGRETTTAGGSVGPMAALALPIGDMCFVSLLRFVRRQPILASDRSHVHHRLLRRGITARRASLILHCGTVACGLVAILLGSVHSYWTVGILVAALTAVLGVVLCWDCVELKALCGFVRAGAFRSLVNSRVSIEDLKNEIAAASTTEECWDVIRRTYGLYGFHSAEMVCGPVRYIDGDGLASEAGAWEMRIPVRGSGHICLRRRRSHLDSIGAAAAYGDALHSSLGPTDRFGPAEAQRARARAVSFGGGLMLEGSRLPKNLATDRTGS